ncbi:secreted RxLR effector protein 161-like [Lathyrus oleraceus]|uniref:secreted RxLR effector protein 161-like n=1 Tax=Pisum sativum TaxID=3888 RepID=UPI0021CF5A2F|nr:secreted RxLR effector protein 161-like [Pisum sativum]
MHQIRYACEILKTFEMQDCNPTSTSSESRLQLSKDSDEDDVDPMQYKRLIGSLRCLYHTGPYLAYCVAMISRFIENPKVSHLAATKRILMCLKGTLDYGILFPSVDEGKECKLVGYTDSSWYGDVEYRKLTVGYLFMLGGVSFAWSSRKEPVVALSSCEAEYIVVSLCTCQVTWMMNLV